jgi:peptide/nickel transport system ATP-binding protein
MAVETLVRVENLTKQFDISQGFFVRRREYLTAVRQVSFEIGVGESLGLVGESGSGKTTTGKMLVRLLKPTEGHIYLKSGSGQYDDVATIGAADMRQFRRSVQMIFQDPYESLNPRLTIFDAVSEPLQVQKIGTLIERRQQVEEMLHLVGLRPASTFMFRYPHELSGGQRQRVAIARALIVNPKLIVADEPTSMLDVSIRIGIMKLMQDLGRRLGVSYLYITHDLAVARYMCQRIAVMYKGEIVEMGDVEQILNEPQHDYTKSLLAAVPVPDPRAKRPVL